MSSTISNMAEPVKRRYDNSRRQAQVRATSRKVIEAANHLFTEHGYPATTIDAIAEAADTPLPTLYRLFGTKRALLAAVLDTSFGGDDQPIAFADRPAVRAALAEPDPGKMVNAFARIVREFMDRSSAIQHVLATAAQVDAEAAEVLTEIRRQRHTGQSRIVTALEARGALDPDLDTSEAADIVYALLSPDMHRILTVERGWDAGRYERWIARSLTSLLPAGHRPPPGPEQQAPGARPGHARPAATKRTRATTPQPGRSQRPI
jgi:AcrR family transcriptional regulator